MKRDTIESKRKCEKCGKPLSRYNKSNDCFHHGLSPDFNPRFKPQLGNRTGNKFLATYLTEYGLIED